MIKPRTIYFTLIAALLVAGGCFLLAFGSAIFCCSPLESGAGFWRLERITYGLLPIAIALTVVRVAMKLCERAYVRRRNVWLVSSGLIVLAVIVDLALFVEYRRTAYEQIEPVWNVALGEFDWGSGEVRLPAGFTYKADLGIDTFIGRFTSRDGKIVIIHDIGELAGEHGAIGRFTETTTRGARVRIARAKLPDGQGGVRLVSAVSFPDSGCASFFPASVSAADDATIDMIARTFRPKSRMPSWLLPLLPEVLRTDCRYRFRLPSAF